MPRQQGSYYSKQLQLARSEKRIGRVPYEPRLPVATFWDLGIGDATAIWFAQSVGKEIRLIDYYETTGEGMAYYAKILKERPYAYRGHWMPFDADIRELGTGKSRREVAESLGIRPLNLVSRMAVDDGIEAARNIFSRCWFDEEKCRQGLNALAQYHKEFDEERREVKNKPYHDCCRFGRRWRAKTRARRCHPRALAHHVSGWFALGIILDPETKLPIEIKPLESRDLLFPTQEEAEAHALLLCKAWIDEYGGPPVKR